MKGGGRGFALAGLLCLLTHMVLCGPQSNITAVGECVVVLVLKTGVATGTCCCLLSVLACRLWPMLLWVVHIGDGRSVCLLTNMVSSTRDGWVSAEAQGCLDTQGQGKGKHCTHKGRLSGRPGGGVAVTRELLDLLPATHS
jgi:hypothetical protein